MGRVNKLILDERDLRIYLKERFIGSKEFRFLFCWCTAGSGRSGLVAFLQQLLFVIVKWYRQDNLFE